MVYDCIVLGVGGIGSSAFLSAAKKGWNVLAIDQFGGAHDRGSSHGRTRIIRTAYFEHPNYVPLAQRAWDAWHELQRNSDVKLIQQTGLLQVGPADGEVVTGTLASADAHQLEIEVLESEEAKRRFPVLKIPENNAILFEKQAGFLLIENCIAHAIRQAKQLGGQMLANCKILGIKANPDGLFELAAQNETFVTERLIIASGPWSMELLQDLDIEITILRKQQMWFQFDRPDVKFQFGFPAFLFETKAGCYYGFPEIDYLGVKVAEHTGGTQVKHPEYLDRECDRGELAATESFIDDTFDFNKRRLVHHSVCMYSMSKDHHFMVDRHPRSSRIVFAAGLSGHGFKFAPVLGDHLIELLEQNEESAFDFLKLGNRKLNT